MYKQHSVKLFPAELELLRMLVQREQWSARKARQAVHRDRRHAGRKFDSVIDGLEVLDSKLGLANVEGGAAVISGFFPCYDREGSGLPDDGRGIDAVNAHSWVDYKLADRYRHLADYRIARREAINRLKHARHRGAANVRDLQFVAAAARREYGQALKAGGWSL